MLYFVQTKPNLTMKKLFVAVMALFILASCSSDDDGAPSPYGNPDPNTVLVKKIVDTYPSGFVLTSTYVYSGTKVNKILRSDGSHFEFDYNDNDLPIEMRYYGGEMLAYTKFYTYDESNRLKTYTMLYNPGDCIKYMYFYNSDGTITAAQYTGNFVEATNYSHSDIYTFENNNLTKVTFSDGDWPYILETNLTYDGKNSFDKNIAGRNIFGLADGYGWASNRTQVSSDNGSEEFPIPPSSFTYTYNEDNYPVKAVQSLAQYDSSYTTEYFY